MNLLSYWKFIFLTLALLLNSLLCAVHVQAQEIDQEAVDLLGEVDSVLGNSPGMEFKAELMARMIGRDYHQVALFKIQKDPLKIYYKQYAFKKLRLLF